MINLFYQFNEKYVPYAGISMVSVLENNRNEDEIAFWILGEDLSQESISEIRGFIENFNSQETLRYVYFFEADGLFSMMRNIGIPMYRGSYAANARLFVSEFIPNSVERLIYLDADTIINGELTELYHIDLENNVIAMVYDSLGEKHKEEIGLKPQDGYFNSGMILFDLFKWRQANVTKRIIEHVRTVRNSYPSPDQDLLNVVCNGKIMALSPKYNFQPSHAVFSEKQYFSCYGKTKYYSGREIERDRNEVIIYHCFRFLGEFPWNSRNLHPFNYLFDYYLQLSPWKYYVKEKAICSWPIKIEKVLYQIIPKWLYIRIFSFGHRMFYLQAERKSKKHQISKSM